jgi:hypothetical protein
MINRLKLALDQIEYSALVDVALKELRNPTDQARYIVRQELIRRGLLPADQHPLEMTDVNTDQIRRAQS